MFVVFGREVIDFSNQVFYAGEGTTADGFVGDQCEEALDLIEPRAVGWGSNSASMFHTTFGQSLQRIHFNPELTTSYTTHEGTIQI